MGLTQTDWGAEAGRILVLDRGRRLRNDQENKIAMMKP